MRTNAVHVLSLLQWTLVFFTPRGFAQNVTVHNCTVQEGKSAKFECDSSATSPFYYYRYFAKNINPPVNVAQTKEQYSWQVYAMNASNSLTNLQTIPKFLARSIRPLTINNFTMEFHNNIICCQGMNRGMNSKKQNDQMVESLSKMICYHVNVQFSPRKLLSYINFGKWIAPEYPSYGQRTAMSCPLEGNPSASYQWYFEKLLIGNYNRSHSDRVPIHPDSYLNIIFLNNDRTLFFRKVLEEHNGYYICNADNYLGNKTSIKLELSNIKKCTTFKASHPSVSINASDNLVVYVGGDLSIDCTVASLVQADSAITMWYKDNIAVANGNYSPPDPRVTWFSHSFDEFYCRQIFTLSIRNLTFKDSGTYSCVSTISDYTRITDTFLITVTVPIKQPNYKSLILKLSIPVSVVIILLAIFVMLITYYYQRKRHIKLQKALEEYQKRRLPKKGGYQYEFFFAMTEEGEDKLAVDKLYIVLKQSFSIYYHMDQYLPGRTKVEMVAEGIKNSRFIVLMLSKAYLQQKDELSRLELIHTINRIREEFTKCAVIVTLEDNLHIPYKLRHIMKFSKENADIKLRELALSSDIYGPDSITSEDTELVDDDDDNDDGMELELLNN